MWQRAGGAAIAAFVGISVFAGGNAVGVRFSNRELAPLWGAGVRFGLSAAVLLVVAAAVHVPLPRGRALLGSAVYGVVSFAGGFGLIYVGLVRVPAGLGQTLLALVPLLTLLLAVGEHQERLRRRTLLGSLSAAVGVAVMSSGGSVQVGSLLPLLAVLAAALLLAQGTVVLRAVPRTHPVAVNAVAMAAATPLLLLASRLLGEPWRLPTDAETWLALGYLVILGSVLVFVLYAVLLATWPASRAAYVFVVLPLVTTVLSWWLDDEPLTPWLLAGGALVLAGVYLGALHRSR